MEQSREHRLYTVLCDGEPVGFVMLKRHNPYTWEVYCMGLLAPYHRRGIGRELIGWCVREATAQGARFLTIKTLADTDPDINYAKTRSFYQAMGFLPLEIFATLWGEENPCLLLVRVL